MIRKILYQYEKRDPNNEGEVIKSDDQWEIIEQNTTSLDQNLLIASKDTRIPTLKTFWINNKHELAVLEDNQAMWLEIVETTPKLLDKMVNDYWDSTAFEGIMAVFSDNASDPIQAERSAGLRNVRTKLVGLMKGDIAPFTCMSELRTQLLGMTREITENDLQAYVFFCVFGVQCSICDGQIASRCGFA